MILVSTISFWRVDYYHAVYSYVWCDVNFAYIMFVYIATLAVRLRESEDHPGTWESRVSGTTVHSFLPNILRY